MTERTEYSASISTDGRQLNPIKHPEMNDQLILKLEND